MVKIGKCIGFCVYRRSYLVCPPVVCMCTPGSVSYMYNSCAVYYQVLVPALRMTKFMWRTAPYIILFVWGLFNRCSLGSSLLIILLWALINRSLFCMFVYVQFFSLSQLSSNKPCSSVASSMFREKQKQVVNAPHEHACQVRESWIQWYNRGMRCGGSMKHMKPGWWLLRAGQALHVFRHFLENEKLHIFGGCCKAWIGWAIG